MPKSYCPYLSDLETGGHLGSIEEDEESPTPEEEGAHPPSPWEYENGIIVKRSKKYKYGVSRVIKPQANC